MRKISIILKNILSGILFLTLCSSLSAQSFLKTLHSDSTHWDVAKFELFGIDMQNLTLSGKDNVSGFDSLWLNSIGGGFFAGEIREDGNNQKLWYKQPGLPTEYLVMDMGLGINDSFDFMGYMGLHSIPVDSVYYLDGRKHIRFFVEIHSWNDSIEFIEGVGPNITVAYQNSDIAEHYSVCTYILSHLEYSTSNSNFYNCLPNPQNVPYTDQSVNDFIYYYDNGKIHIRSNSFFSEACTLTMYDIYGKLKKELTFNSNHYMLDISHFPDGFYIIQILVHNSRFCFKICKY